jgi:hypothetical protein
LVEVATEFARRIRSVLNSDLSIAISDPATFERRVADLSWDANIVPAKLYRAMSGKWEAEQEDDFLKEASLEDASRSAEVALKALDNCLDILEEVSAGALEKRGEIEEIVSLGDSLRTSIREEFPDKR